MMKLPLLGACHSVLTATALIAAPPDHFNVVWDSPSENHHGSMPLGNGDIALNAWMTRQGELHFYIAKTDAWDDNARLLKVGKVRIRFEPNPVGPHTPFRQELKLGEGSIEVKAGGATFRLWVDANHPVIHLTAHTLAPMEATAFVELWRTNQQELAELQVSDVMLDRRAPDQKHAPTLLEPDTLLTGHPDRVGWLHHNIKSVGPRLMAEVQGLTGFEQADPLLHRTFGAVLTAHNGTRVDDRTLHSPPARSHRFDLFVLTRHPSTPEDWRADMDDTIRRAEAQPFQERQAAHAAWWNEFWNRSWIRASTRTNAAGSTTSAIPTNAHPVRLGMDQHDGNRFVGELGRVSLFAEALAETDVAALAQSARDQPLPAGSEPVFSGRALTPRVLPDSAAWDLHCGLTVEAWVKPQTFGGSGARLVDKITPGGRDGFLLDTHPANSLRFISGASILQQKDALPAGQWTHVAAVVDSHGGSRLYVNGHRRAEAAGTTSDDAVHVSRMYHLQRFITACASRGAYPVKFNGSLFTVPPGPTERDPDYRRWGPGYWWQNTRLPYLSLCTSGDYDLLKPLFRMYADELLPLCRYRTRQYLDHDGAFYPECLMFWGAIFSETYGWTPFEQRTDKLQESGWHKWEWVGGLELSWMMLDYYDHTLDEDFLHRTALPFTREILTFFDQHYATNAQGTLVMHPSQALETWWHCTNAMPELAGCLAVTERLLALSKPAVAAPDRALWQRLRAKLPPIPLRDINGRTALAPAGFFAEKRNVENPELYAVFPFRLFAFNRPNADWAVAALEHRWDRGHFGWRQDDIFMAYLGLADETRKAVVRRAREKDPNERFPAFWGPNYDWTPDQDHGGVLMKSVQSMLLQTDGRKIFLLPAWPKTWDVDFKLHAPERTVLEGVVRDGTVVELNITPESRRADVVIPPASPD